MKEIAYLGFISPLEKSVMNELAEIERCNKILAYFLGDEEKAKELMSYYCQRGWRCDKALKYIFRSRALGWSIEEIKESV